MPQRQCVLRLILQQSTWAILPLRSPSPCMAHKQATSPGRYKHVGAIGLTRAWLRAARNGCTYLTLTGSPTWIAFLSLATSFWSVPSPCRKRLWWAGGQAGRHSEVSWW